MTKASVMVLTLLMAAAGLAAAELENPSWIDEVGDRVPTHTVVPIYPEKARRDRIEGEVQVCYDVDRKGRPYRVAVRSSSNRMFERPALRAIRASLYKPLADDEQTSGIKTCRTFRFQLQPIPIEDDQPLADDKRAARSVLDMSMMIVMGPTPPGTGVTAAATLIAAS